MDNTTPPPPPSSEPPSSDTQEENSTFTFNTSAGGISFSIRPIEEIRNITTIYPPLSRNINTIYYDPILTFLPIGGGGAPAGVNSVLNTSLYDKETFKHVLSDEGKEQIVHRKYG